jgi:DNA-binding winged helix-turn-helix (wHTH) protein
MTDRDSPVASYAFDGVVVDVANFRVLVGEAPRRITPRAFEVLVYLVTNPGRVVGKQELFDAVWKEAFVTDNALTRMVKEIRRVLGDDAEAPRFIETVPRRGYRFVAGVTASHAAHHTRPPEPASVAVLPFLDQTGGPESAYLTEGITESLINLLARARHLRVVPRSTVFAPAGRGAGPLERGRELKVGAVVSGRLLAHGDTLVVRAELLDVANEAQVWGNEYR